MHSSTQYLGYASPSSLLAVTYFRQWVKVGLSSEGRGGLVVVGGGGDVCVVEPMPPMVVVGVVVLVVVAVAVVVVVMPLVVVAVVVVVVVVIVLLVSGVVEVVLEPSSRVAVLWHTKYPVASQSADCNFSVVYLKHKSPAAAAA